MKYLAIWLNSLRCKREFQLGVFKLADIIICNTNHRQTSHTYGIMCKKCSLSNTTHSTTSTMVPPSFTFLYVPISALLPDLRQVDLIPGNFVDTTVPLALTPHHQIKLRIFQLVQCSHQFQLPLWKKLSQVHSSRWETLS